MGIDVLRVNLTQRNHVTFETFIKKVLRTRSQFRKRTAYQVISDYYKRVNSSSVIKKVVKRNCSYVTDELVYDPDVGFNCVIDCLAVINSKKADEL